VTDHYFGYADPVFFDDLSRLDDRATRFAQAGLPAPDGWSRHDGGVWVELMPDGVRLPEQGWKIRVAGRSEDAAKLVAMVYEHCVAARAGFKFLRSSRVADIANSKAAVRGSGGKLITIYPAGTASLRRLLDDLGGLLDGFPSPYVLGDLRWREGPLYLRYGGFARRYCRDDDGAWRLAVADPAGRLVPDVRGPVFEAPPDALVPDFIAERLTAGESGEQLPYEIDGALRFTNAGGIYTGTDPATGDRVVVREARPYAGLDDHGRDAVARMDHEHALRRRLGDLDVLPRLIDRFRCWEHEFPVEEFVEGAQLHAHRSASASPMSPWSVRIDRGMSPRADTEPVRCHDGGKGAHGSG
jgi:class III lanthionine synthetase